MELNVNGWTGNGWLSDRMHGMMHEFNQRTSPRRIMPAADVVEKKDAYHFYFEIPGLTSDAFDVRVENGALVIAGERKHPEWPDDAKVHVSERTYGAIRRAFELPEDASADKVQASYRDGVLEVTVEKRPEAKPVKIQVN